MVYEKSICKIDYVLKADYPAYVGLSLNKVTLKQGHRQIENRIYIRDTKEIKEQKKLYRKRESGKGIQQRKRDSRQIDKLT